MTVDDRLAQLETDSRNQQVVELRVTRVEDRLTAVEKNIDELRNPAPADGRGKNARPDKKTQPVAQRSTPAPRPVSQEKKPAAPVVVGTVVLDDPTPQPSVSYLPAANNKGGAPSPASSPAPSYSAPSLAQSVPPPAPSAAAGKPVSAPGSAPGLTPTNMNAPAPRPVAKSAPAAKTAPGTGSSAYNNALALYNKGQYAKANDAFNTFLQQSPNSSLAPNAMYWRGECLYSQDQFDQAILIFKDVAGKYPKHDKAAAALLKAGYAYERMGDMDNARFYWQLLLDDFPRSSPAAMAKKRMNARG